MRINRKPRLCLSEGARISCDHRILFSFQKNHLKLTFYTARICLFMYPQHGHGGGGNTDCRVSSVRGGVPAEWERWRGLMRHLWSTKIMAQSPSAIGVIKMSIQLLQCVSVYSEARGAKWNLFWCYTSLCTQPSGNFGEAAETEALRRGRLSIFFSLLSPLSFHLSILDLSMASIH